MKLFRFRSLEIMIIPRAARMRANAVFMSFHDFRHDRSPMEKKENGLGYFMFDGLQLVLVRRLLVFDISYLVWRTLQELVAGFLVVFLDGFIELVIVSLCAFLGMNSSRQFTP